MDILVYGTINSFTLALMALGFTLVYGVSRIPNFAHGALYVIAGFALWVGLNTLGLNYLLSALLALAMIGVIGAAMYQSVLIRVRSWSFCGGWVSKV
jgi:branched-chain amino acid transport system permease protein